MKQLARWIVVTKLRFLASIVLRRYKPRIIGITGSVGKTTTTQLIAKMLEGTFRLQSAPGYNSEIGLPLAILDPELSKNGSPAGAGEWFKALWRYAVVAVGPRREYAEVLILEMSADQPGDISYLARLAPPDVAVVTNVQPVHLQNYDSIEGIAREKGQIVRHLKQGGMAVLNFDDTRVRMMRTLTREPASFYGMTDESNIWADQISYSPDGLKATLHLRENEGGPTKTWQLTTSLLGQNQLYGVLAAFAVAYATGVAPEQAIEAVRSFRGPAGRMRPLRGRGSMVIIDDSYNSSPEAALASLAVLKQFPSPHRAVLGDMRELGETRAELHRMVGESLGWIDELVAVGPESKVLAEAAEEAGAKKVTHVESTEAGIPLTADWTNGSVLVKGSQNTLYLERLVKTMLADPRDERLLNQRLKNPLHAKTVSETGAKS